MWPRNTLVVIQEEFVQGCARSGVCSCVGCCCSAGKGSCLAKFNRKHWMQTWRYKMDEVKALQCLVVTPLLLKHFSHHFCYLGLISGGSEFPDHKVAKDSCVFWKMTTFIIWRILIRRRMTRLLSLPAFENTGLSNICFIHRHFSFPTIQLQFRWPLQWISGAFSLKFIVLCAQPVLSMHQNITEPYL